MVLDSFLLNTQQYKGKVEQIQGKELCPLTHDDPHDIVCSLIEKGSLLVASWLMVTNFNFFTTKWYVL